MKIDTERTDDCLRMVIAGPLDQKTSGELSIQARSLILRGLRRVEVDLSEVSYLDSTGLGALFGIKLLCKKVRAEPVLVSPSEAVAKILRQSSMESVFTILP